MVSAASFPSRKKRFSEVVVYGGVVSPVIELTEARQEVFRLSVLGPIDETIVADRSGASDFVDADDYWPEALQCLDGLYVDKNQTQNDQR